MEITRINLAALWIMLMLVYLLGDVLRIFSGDFVPGQIEGKTVSQAMWLGISVLMLIPIIMIFLSLNVDYPIIRWITIIVSLFFFAFNLFGLPTYPSAYDKFLIVVGLVFNLIIVWYAWTWIQS